MPRFFALLVTTAVALGVLGSARLARAQVGYGVLYSFSGSPNDGARPLASLIQATDGNFYGTTRQGGSADLGTVFRIATDGTVTILHEFTGSPDGAHPRPALIQATDGNFYGTTQDGGAANHGTVFQIILDGTVTILHSFTGFPDGNSPQAALIQATDGNFYGTTQTGGSAEKNQGTVFRMTPDGTVTILHAFTGDADGANPEAALIQATDGNFYGTTPMGGSGACPLGCGTAFRMSPDGTVTILHAFAGNPDGASPHAALIQATDGNFYGTTGGGSSTGLGTVFRMTPDGTVTILHAFSELEGIFPGAALIQATDGNFYGTTGQAGGPGCSPFGCGTVFLMTPDGTVTILYAFTGDPDGANPDAALIQATDGNIYGTTFRGGSAGWGTIFRLTLSASPF